MSVTSISEINGTIGIYCDHYIASEIDYRNTKVFRINYN